MQDITLNITFKKNVQNFHEKERTQEPVVIKTIYRYSQKTIDTYCTKVFGVNTGCESRTYFGNQYNNEKYIHGRYNSIMDFLMYGKMLCPDEKRSFIP